MLNLDIANEYVDALRKMNGGGALGQNASRLLGNRPVKKVDPSGCNQTFLQELV